MKYLVSLLVVFSTLGVIHSQTVISRHNIHVGSKKLERNQASPEKLEEEKASREKDREARLLQNILKHGDNEPREYNSSQGKALYTNGIWKFIIQARDSETGLYRIEYKLNDSSVEVYRNPLIIKQPGWNTIEYRSIDRAGNKENWRVTRIFRDVVPPSLHWNFEGSHFQIGEKYFITPETKIKSLAIDKESGLKGIYYSENQSNWKAWDEDGYKPKLGENENNRTIFLQIRALDQVNNRSELVKISMEVVNSVSNPGIHTARIWEKDGNRFCSKNTRVSFSKNQSQLAETIYYREMNSQDWREYTTGEIRPSQNIESGEWGLEYKTSNALNQESITEKWTCSMDETPPQTEILKKEDK
jgi:hypothetical protein